MCINCPSGGTRTHADVVHFGGDELLRSYNSIEMGWKTKTHDGRKRSSSSQASRNDQTSIMDDFPCFHPFAASSFHSSETEQMFATRPRAPLNPIAHQYTRQNIMKAVPLHPFSGWLLRWGTNICSLRTHTGESCTRKHQ